MAQLTFAEYLASVHKKDSATIVGDLNRAKDAGKTFINAAYIRSCPVCEAPDAMYQEGALSTGLPLEHYTPEFGEVLKNSYMWCSKCGFDQGS